MPCDQQAKPCRASNKPATTGDEKPGVFHVLMLNIMTSGIGQNTAVSLTPDATGKLKDHAEKANATPAKVAAQSESVSVRTSALHAKAAIPKFSMSSTL
ncbi:MAG: hypothetical protein CL930_01525 [Deltaproteobacteria bacterium]|nr:hypothetical protein [Deltaproteobacteria bacterium]